MSSNPWLTRFGRHSWVAVSLSFLPYQGYFFHVLPSESASGLGEAVMVTVFEEPAGICDFQRPLTSLISHGTFVVKRSGRLLPELLGLIARVV